MKAPFELPIKADEELLMLHIQGRLCASLIIGDVDNWNDESRLAYLRYIVRACNSHDALLEACIRAKAYLASLPGEYGIESRHLQAEIKAAIELAQKEG
jgi:hypothetical protein